MTPVWGVRGQGHGSHKLRGLFVPEFSSVVPGHDLTFQEYRLQDPDVADNASAGDFAARWEFLANEKPKTPQSVFDAWKNWSNMNGEIDVLKVLGPS